MSQDGDRRESMDLREGRGGRTAEEAALEDARHLEAQRGERLEVAVSIRCG